LSTDFTSTLTPTPKLMPTPYLKDQIHAQASEKETSPKQTHSETDLEAAVQGFLLLVLLAMNKTENRK
jgi:hypothetical protein